jgi:hypothetical protein
MRVNESLIARRYLTWFDLTNMKGKQMLFDGLCLECL